MSARSNALVHVAADLLRLSLSDIAEDWPRCMPKVALREIAKQENRLKDCAIRVRYAADCLRELDQTCAAKDATIAAKDAEIARLREAVKNAYQEGLEDAEERGALTDDQCWERSEARAALQGEGG